MKYCSQCGQVAGDEYRFCSKCGTDLTGVAAAAGAGPSAWPGAAPAATPGAPAAAKKSNTWVIVLVVAAVVMFLAIPFILIVAAIAIPNLLRARNASNESSAVASVRTINTAAVTYYSEYGHYPALLAQMGPGSGGAPNETQAGLIDAVLTNRVKNGYVFTYEPRREGRTGEITGYEIHADPIRNNDIARHFYSNEDGVIRAERNRPASGASPPLE